MMLFCFLIEGTLHGGFGVSIEAGKMKESVEPSLVELFWVLLDSCGLILPEFFVANKKLN